MTKFCSNCGKELEANNEFCSDCGKSVKAKTNKGIASMVFGLVGLYFAFSCYIGKNDITSLPQYIENPGAFSFGYVLIPLVLGILGIVFGFKSRQIKQNSYNIIGLIAGAISILAAVFIFITIV